ncbi:hypothetical protein SAMN04488564_102130 [Lentzea waywayandensis]|uniref:Uncharacterized protein n=1 Tax=Lentzea waywayandensis TaxID=84724 RepID=A0A1I6DAQ1_9PSEU|nr:DUF5947 family protein [Lentzea waywayandensis]SFR02536.1 hypothetical protein SAMN04488564_102130 [Lentzea waywayandensis]
MNGSHGLQRFARPPGTLLEQRSAQMRQLEQCEMCGTPVAARHGHVVDTRRRSLMCACRACFLLFTKGAARRSRYRAVPERYLADPLRPVTPVEWERLDIPVSSAFVLRADAGITAFHPSPAGATERPLNPGFWTEFAAAHPLVAAAESDVEAILFRRGANDVDCYLVPIDVCYRLVGTVRLYWSGMDGGDQVRDHIDELFAEIRAKAGGLPGGAR